MVYVIVNSVFGLINAFCSDDMGVLIVSICVMGACVSLFRVLRSAACA